MFSMEFSSHHATDMLIVPEIIVPKTEFNQTRMKNILLFWNLLVFGTMMNSSYWKQLTKLVK